MFLAINEIDAKLRYSLIVWLTYTSFLFDVFLIWIGFLDWLIRIDLLLIIGRQIQYYFSSEANRTLALSNLKFIG